jgi:flagellar biosynthesis GTPase FlhF
MKVCQKENCSLPAIPRGKFCESHCTVRRIRESTRDNESLERERVQRSIREQRIQELLRADYLAEEERKKKVLEERYLEERLLREEQIREYEETEKLDRERINREREEQDKIVEETRKREDEIVEKRRRLDEYETSAQDAPFYKVKFVFPNLQGLSIIHSFSKNCLFSNIFDFLDIFMIDSGINFEGYDIISYPNLVFEKDTHSEKRFSDAISNKNVQFIVKERELD